MTQPLTQCISPLTIIIAALSFFLSPIALCQSTASGDPTPVPKFEFHPERRLTADGEEYNALLLSHDERQLLIASEKGEVIVWDTAAKRISKRLNLGKPVHALASIPKSPFIVAAGSGRLVNSESPTVRRWNTDDGTYMDFTGLDSRTFVTVLATSEDGKFVAAGGVTPDAGQIIVWDTSSGEVLAKWTQKDFPIALLVLGRKILGSMADLAMIVGDGDMRSNVLEFSLGQQNSKPIDIPVSKGGYFDNFTRSPNGKWITIAEHGSGPARLLVLDAATLTKKSEGDGGSLTWIDGERFLLFRDIDPTSVQRIADSGEMIPYKKFTKGDWGLHVGRGFGLTGAVVSKDMTRAWSVYRDGPELIEWNLDSNSATMLVYPIGGTYALSKVTWPEQSNALLTAGGDGYVRLWDQSTGKMIRETKVAPEGSFVTDAKFVRGSTSCILAVSPVSYEQDRRLIANILIVDLMNGAKRSLADVEGSVAAVSATSNDIRYSTGNEIVIESVLPGERKRVIPIGRFITKPTFSPDGQWAAGVDEKGDLRLIDLTTGKIKVHEGQFNTFSTVAVPNGAKSVFMAVGEGQLAQWDVPTGKLQQRELPSLRESHSRSDYLSFDSEGKRLLATGNHADLGIYDLQTGSELFYSRFAGASHWVERALLQGNELLLSTDKGVVVIGTLNQTDK